MDFIKGNEQVKIDPSGIDISGVGNIIIDSNSITGDISFINDSFIINSTSEITINANNKVNFPSSIHRFGQGSSSVNIINGKIDIGENIEPIDTKLFIHGHGYNSNPGSHVIYSKGGQHHPSQTSDPYSEFIQRGFHFSSGAEKGPLFKFKLSDWAVNANDIPISEPGILVEGKGGENFFRVNQNGNVGIGTSNPTSRLEINTSSNGINNHLKLNRWDGGKYYSIIRHEVCPEVTTIDSLQFIVEGANDATPDNDDVKMVINSNGNVGIGTTNPGYPLTIDATPPSAAVMNSHVYTDTGGFTYGGNLSFDIAVRIAQGNLWMTGETVYESDSRIKTDISNINDDRALQQVNLLESYEYNYINPIRKRPMKTIGFIAQEAKEVIPNAVSLHTGFVPDEMRIIIEPQWEGSTLTIPDLDMSGNFTGKAKFYVSNDPSGNDEVCKEVEIKEVPDNSRPLFPTATKFVAEFDKPWSNIFFYGKEVTDFHTIDKNQIFALHHSAIQELSRKNDEKTEKISVLENKVNSITITNALLKSSNESLKSRLEALENIVAGLQNN